MTATTAMSSSMPNGPDPSFGSLDDQEATWYLNQNSYGDAAWMNQESSSMHFTTTATQPQPVWAAASQDHASVFDGNQSAFSGNYLNPYLSPASIAGDFGHASSHSRSQSRNYSAHQTRDDAMDVQSANHSPSMHTALSNSSDDGSIYAERTPPPLLYPQSVVAKHEHTLKPPLTRPTTRRRSTAPSAVITAGRNAPKDAAAAAAAAAAEKVRERRSGHSAVERKYRENLNGKIEVLRQVLIEAHRSYDVKTQSNMSHSRHNSAHGSSRGSSLIPGRNSGGAGAPHKDGYPPPDSVITFAATIGSKKSDVLSTAIHYIKEAEQSRSVLMQQVSFLQNQVVKLEGLICGGNNNGNSECANSRNGAGARGDMKIRMMNG